MKRLAIALASIVLLGTGAAAAPPAVPATAKRPQRIAMIAKSSANFVFIAARKGAEDAAAELSRKHGLKVEVAWLTPPKEDPAAQVEAIAQAVREGATAVLVSCSDPEKLVPAIDAAVARGVPVMTFDSDAPASKRFSFYGSDDGDLGEKVMTELSEQIGGKGKVAILAGNPDAANLRSRVEGVKRAAARLKGIEIVDLVHHVETPQAAAAEVLRVNAAHPDLAGWAMVGGWPLFRSSQTPALVADLRQRKLKVVAIDALPDELSYVDNEIVPVLWAQPIYLWGKVGVETIFDKLVLGKTVPERIRMEPVRVSKRTLGSWARQLRDWGFTGLPQEYLDLP